MLAAQVTHAAGESAGGPLSPGTFAVVLQAPQEALEALERRLEAQGVPHRAIRENDPPLGLTAIGICPAPKDTLKRFVSSLGLLR
jgi:peptidyl-tRNA hydrolase